jgi:elongation of very long chain fatty acids protein 6
MIITLLQLSQMIIGCWINLQAREYKKNGEMCQVTDENLKVSLIMYGTYFLLFAHFFLGSYIYKTKRANKENDKQQEKKSK